MKQESQYSCYFFFSDSGRECEMSFSYPSVRLKCAIVTSKEENGLSWIEKSFS